MEKRRGHMRALAGEVARIAAPALGKRGFGSAQLITEWATVVGSEWAGKISPERLSFAPGERRDGTLRVRVAAGCAPEIQHRAPQLLERINGFFGYAAVARLVLVQGPPLRPPRPPARTLRPLAPGDRDALDRRLAGIDDPGLRDALRRLGEAVIGSDRGR
ncbi:MAG TPA: DciA family protein [Stellaceae bacterium]|nr:DciA family protein [Stellaceae bacterium]